MQRSAFSFFFILLFSAAGFHPSAQASDHIDGPLTTEHAVGDITDLFAFPAAEDKDRLVLVMNTYPLAFDGSHFSERITYSFLVREVSRNGVHGNLRAAGQKARIDCTFDVPHGHGARPTVSCRTASGRKWRAFVGDTARKGADGFRIFAGHRADPFFFNKEWAGAASSEGRLLEGDFDNTMDHTNILSLVVEIDVDLLFGDEATPFLGIVAQTTTQDRETGQLRRLDRVGRPEITNVSMVARGGATDLRDAYNREQPFAVPAQRKARYASRLFQNIGYYDRLDGKRHWSVEKRKELADVLANDYLVIDLRKPCDRFNFFDIEMAVLNDRQHTTCGGRAIHDDIMDRLYSVYINGGHGPRIRDGVDRPYRPALDGFPYLNEPDFSLRAWLKAKAGKLALWFRSIFG